MEEHVTPLAITHLLQHTLRSLCIHGNSQWIYAVFWRILPRNYPPPKWDINGGAYDRSRGNRRNWILVWEDGFCNFASSAAAAAAASELSSGDCPTTPAAAYSHSNSCGFQQFQGLQPELFFKMSHEIYNYGEGLIGKVAADHSHKWVYREPNDQSELNFLSVWHNSSDLHPRTWEAQFQSGIKTIALIAVGEGVVQLGAVNKVEEDLSYVVTLRKKLSYIESIPGVLLPHPSSSAFPYTTPEAAAWHFQQVSQPQDYYTDHHHHQHSISETLNNNLHNYDHQQPLNMKISPSMSSLEALLSKLPPVIIPPQLHSSTSPYDHHHSSPQFTSAMPPLSIQKIAMKEENEEDDEGYEGSAATYTHHHHHHHHQQQQHHYYQL